MFNIIRKKINTGFSIILVVIISSTIYNTYTYNNSNINVGIQSIAAITEEQSASIRRTFTNDVRYQ